MNQTRTHNKANEIASIGGSSSYVASDKNGNMTKLPKIDNWSAAFTCVYDPWNRLVQVKDGTTNVATYSYNGLNHRVKKVVGSETRLFYFNSNWQCLEERIGTTVDTTYTWGLRYIDDLVCRDKGEERLYSIADPNWNVVALADTSGTVKERYVYSSFGRAGICDVGFGIKTASSYVWTRTFTGQVYDAETGLMLYRNRFYHNGLGRFVTRDPIGYLASDTSLYRYVFIDSVSLLDIYGWQGAEGIQISPARPEKLQLVHPVRPPGSVLIPQRRSPIINELENRIQEMMSKPQSPIDWDAVSALAILEIQLNRNVTPIPEWLRRIHEDTLSQEKKCEPWNGERWIRELGLYDGDYGLPERFELLLNKVPQYRDPLKRIQDENRNRTFRFGREYGGYDPNQQIYPLVHPLLRDRYDLPEWYVPPGKNKLELNIKPENLLQENDGKNVIELDVHIWF